MGYASYLFKLRCAPFIIQWMQKVNFRNMEKEWSESYGVLEGARATFPGGNTANCFVVGDGTRPLTGLLTAMNTGWNVTVIDPALKQKYYPENVKRLTFVPKRLEDTSFEADTAIVLLPHAHVTLSAVLKHIKATKLHIVALPCCIKQNAVLNLKPDIEYDDPWILSEKRTIKIWRNIFNME